MVEMKRQDERIQFFFEESERFLMSGAALTEWSVFISESVYTAFVNGADLSTIITTGVCIEAYLRAELNSNQKFSELIDQGKCFLGADLCERLHHFRKYRNSWVHCDSRNDTKILDCRESIEIELEEWSFKSITLHFEVLYSMPFV